jgi:hypothetical protein
MGAAMGGSLRFVLGEGRWVPWHLFMLFWLLPLDWFASWLQETWEATGPNGAEGMLVVLSLAHSALVGASIVNGVLWARTRPPGWRRALGVLVSLAGAIAVPLALARLAELGQGPFLAGFWSAVALVYLANLAALDRYRRWSRRTS